MSTLLLLTVIGATPIAFFLSPTYAQICQTKDQFAAQCTARFGGVADGANCFYASTIGSWVQANGICNQKDAVLAQIHTDSEFMKINSYLTAKWPAPGGYLLIGLQRDGNNPISNNCSDTQNTTYWYDNGVKNPNLSVANTWLRTRQKCVNEIISGPVLGGTCFVINSIIDANFDKFGGQVCTSAAVVLCQYRSPIENYTLTNASCLAETPIESFPAVQPQECAAVCTKRMWCRSFNFGTYSSDCSSGICQLFSWSVNDACAGTCQKTYTLATSPFQACYRYNYVP